MNHSPSKPYMPISDDMDQKSKLLYAVNSMAEILLTSDEESFENSLREGMALVARCLKIDRIYIWQNKMVNGSLQYVQQLEWLGYYNTEGKTVHSKESFPYNNSIPEWEKKFIRGECVNGPLVSLSKTEQDCLGPYGIKSVLVIPVHLRDLFWGFVSFDDCHQERTFTEDEVSILRSSNYMMASTMDRHQTAARMREADEHAKLMLDATPLCCSLWDRNLNLIDCNAAVVDFFGLKDKQEYLDRFFELSPEYQPDGSPSTKKALENITASFNTDRSVYEWVHQMPDGSLVPAEITIVRVKRGDEYIIAGYTRDLREYKKMMNAIEYKDILLHTVNEVASILLQSEENDFENNLRLCMGKMAVSVSADRMYIWKNHMMEDELCCTQVYEWSGEVEPQQGGKYTVDIPYSNTPAWKQLLSSGQCINNSVRNLTPEEQSQLIPQGVLSILVVPVFLHDQFWGFVGFDDCRNERIFSETEVSILCSGSLLIANALLRNEMTHEIKAAIEQAQAASRAKSAFLARMSHEIRTPMNVIAGMTELTLRENIPPAIYEHVLSIKHASANMLSLINDVLDFSKIEAGSLTITSSEYSLTSLINNIIITIRMKVSEKPVLFTVNIDSNIPNRLIGDETRIRQILLNVLENAAKYTAEGFISLTVTGTVKEDMIVLTADVSDSGIGIQKNDIDKLFDDFSRFDSDRHRNIHGTGLGLAITKSLCQAMGGDISVRSEYGSGSTFTITIPQTISSYEEKFASVSEPDKKRVLLYETRAVYADSIVQSLKNLGVSFTSVSSREELYKELKRGVYSFVFISSLLSEIAGQIIDELKPDTTMVLLTEFGESPVMRGARTIAAPVHSASIANILDDNDDSVVYSENGSELAHFIAPAAKILVVDDLNTNLMVAKGLMLPFQMQVDICESGQKAIEFVQKKRYDLIFMDHMMPGMDGIETVGRIRALEDEGGYYKSVPIIALTANAVSGVKEMFIQSGMNDFLAKPIDITKLYRLLDKWIPKSRKESNAQAQAQLAAHKMPNRIVIEGVDVKEGIEMAGGTADAYFKILSMFHNEGTEKLHKIPDCIQNANLKLYTIYVHAMKSATASIGARKMSDCFRLLEAAGTKGDIKYIRENTESALSELEALLANIHALLLENHDAPPRQDDPESLRNELIKLKEALISRDAGEISDIINALKLVGDDQKTAEILSEISKSILMINYDEAAAIINSLINTA